MQEIINKSEKCILKNHYKYLELVLLKKEIKEALKIKSVLRHKSLGVSMWATKECYRVMKRKDTEEK